MFLICFFLKIYKYNDSKDYKLTRESWPWHHFSCSCTCCSTTTCFASIHTTCYHTTHFTSFLSTFTYHHESNHQPIKYRLRMSNIIQQKMNQQLNRICPKCDNVKPSRYSHCRQCNVCIYRMDHHCNWVGNCVGQFNAKTFLHYLINLFVHCTIVLFYVFVWNVKAILYN